MSKHTKQKPKASRKLLYIKLAWVVAGILALIAYDNTVGGQTKFFAKWIECGRKPVGGHGVIASPLRYYSEEPVINFYRLQGRYFCTPLEAEEAGYSANDRFYLYPHLEAERAKQKGE